MPACGFYEWQGEAGRKQPYYIVPKKGLFAFAGLWERWTVRPGSEAKGEFAGYFPGDVIESFTIVVTDANEFLRPIHNRMPVILGPDEFDGWLSSADVPLDSYPSDEIDAYLVSTRVNRPENDDAACIEPI